MFDTNTDTAQGVTLSEIVHRKRLSHEAREADEKRGMQKKFTTTQAHAALIGAELTQSNTGGFMLRRGSASRHCSDLDTVTEAVRSMHRGHQ